MLLFEKHSCLFHNFFLKSFSLYELWMNKSCYLYGDFFFKFMNYEVWWLVSDFDRLYAKSEFYIRNEPF